MSRKGRRAGVPTPEDLRRLQEQRRKNREEMRAPEPTEEEKRARAEARAANRLALLAPESRELLLKKERQRAAQAFAAVEDAATVTAEPEKEASDG